MTAIRVFILTTDGPVEVQRITAEDPGVKSVICLDGKAVSLPVSPAYEAFVRSPTGVVEACFGHPAYRLDVSGRISEGMSWQLGVFLAHGLHAKGRLARGEAELVILTTGEIDRDLNVLPVEDVPEKLQQAAALIAQLIGQGVTTKVFLPCENVPGKPAQADIVPVDTVTEAFHAIGLEVPVAGLPASTRTATAAPRRWTAPVLATIFVLAAVSAVALWPRSPDRDRTEPEKHAPAAPQPTAPIADLEITAIEFRAPAGKTCAAVHFDAARPRIVETSVRNTGRFTDTVLRGLCGLAYRIANKGPPVHLTVLAARARRGAPMLRSKLFFRNQRLVSGERVSFRVRPPRAKTPLQLQFLLIARTASDRTGAVALPIDFESSPTKITPEIWHSIASRVTGDGVGAIAVSHLLVP